MKMIICDTYSFGLGIFGISLSVASAVFVVTTLFMRGYITIGICFIIEVLVFIALILAGPGAKLFSTFSIKKGAIAFSVPFRKTICVDISSFKYIYKGYYFHGTPLGIGKNIYYIVLSTVCVPDDTLEHLNTISSSAETIKIKYTKKTYGYLFNCLNEKQKNIISSCFCDINADQK